MTQNVGNSIDINAQEEEGNTPLHEAVAANDARLVQELIRNGDSMEAQNLKQHTPLHLATLNKNISMMQILIDAGANVYNFNVSGNTGAHHAAFNGNCDVMKVLLESGYEVNTKNKKGNTLLHLSAREGQKDFVRLLIGEMADINVYNNDGKTPLYRAAYLGYTDIVNMLLSAEPKPWPSKEGLSFLHAAAAGNRLHTIQSVFIDFPDVIKQQLKCNCLSADYCASASGGSDSTWWLRKQMTKCAQIHAPSTNNLDYCKTTYEKSGVDIIRRAKMDGRREPSWLKKSVIDGQIELHFMDDEGNTALHAAVEGGNEETVTSLLDVGALSIARNHRNLTPIDIANKMGTDFQDRLPVRPSTKLNRRLASHLYSVLLSIISQTTGQGDVIDRTEDSDSGSEKHFNKMVEQRKLQVTKVVSNLLTWGVPHERLGSCDRLVLPLAITTNNRTLLPILLAAGFPLTTTDSGLGIVQLAWLTPDITLWVGMVVTRAVRNQLTFEYGILQEILQKRTVSDPCLLRMIDILIKGLNTLITEDLSGDRPWEAQFSSPDKESITQLYITACRCGLTLTAWYVWKAGGTNYVRGTHFNCTALEAAISAGYFSTAFHLVTDTEANPFQKNERGDRLIGLFPEKFDLIEVMLGKDYRTLDKMVDKFKDKDDKRSLQQVIILLIVLFLQFSFDKQSDSTDKTPNRWKSFFGLVLKAYYMVDRQETLYSSSEWMHSLSNILVNKGVNGVTFLQAESIELERSNIYEDTGLDVLRDSYDFDDTDDDFYFLLFTLHANFLQIEIPAGENYISDKKLDYLQHMALKVCCEKPMSLFLHLLVSIAVPNLENSLNEVCNTRPLHHAAKEGNSSAVAYLLQCGASPLQKDRSDILPIQYAAMFGHREAGTILINSMEEGSEKEYQEKLQQSYSKFHDSYLNLYGHGLDCTGISRYLNVHSYDALLASRFEHVKREWNQKGVQKSAEEILVSYKSGEAQEIKDSVTQLLKSLKEQISQKDDLFEGDIEFVGSSEDNVRLYCPDEYDCNLLLKNICAYPGGGMTAKLVNLEDKKMIDFGHKQSMEVQPVKEEIQDLMKGSRFLNKFYNLARKSLLEMDFSCCKLKIMMPGIKRTQVGINLTFLWLGIEYPMLFVDIDFVPTVKAPWPEGLLKPKCGLESCHLEEVYLNNIGEDDWRLSFGPTETKIMKGLLVNKRNVFLACKMILAAFKTENWVPLKLKYDFMFWDSRMFSLHSKGGFALKNCFFQELEEVIEDREWTEDNLLKRACSVYERMCSIAEQVSKEERPPVECPKPVKAYFGSDTEKASVYLCAPEIVMFLREMESSCNL